MKTGSFTRARGTGRISIARRAPVGMERLPSYPELAPPKWMHNYERRRFVGAYRKVVLDKLNARKVWEDLHQLVDGEPILLCWERLDDPNEFCHRQIVAAWFEEQLGEKVREMLNPQMDLFGVDNVALA